MQARSLTASERLFVLGAAGAAAIVLGVAAFGVLRESVGAASGTGRGDTRNLVAGARYPLRWRSNDVVEFRTWTGIASVRVDGTDLVLRTTRPLSDEALVAEHPAGTYLRPHERLGRWEAWATGRYLVDGDERCGPPLLASPDGRYLACLHIINDRNRETNVGFGAVVAFR